MCVCVVHVHVLIVLNNTCTRLLCQIPSILGSGNVPSAELAKPSFPLEEVLHHGQLPPRVRYQVDRTDLVEKVRKLSKELKERFHSLVVFANSAAIPAHVLDTFWSVDEAELIMSGKLLSVHIILCTCTYYVVDT